MGTKSEIGYLTHAFLGAHKWAGMLRNPCVLGVPNKRDKIIIGCMSPAFA